MSDVNEALLYDIGDLNGGTNKAHRLGGYCRVRGPAAERGMRYRSSVFREQRDFAVDTSTRFLLVSDFLQMKRVLPSHYRRLVPLLQAQRAICLLADIQMRVDSIPALSELLNAGTRD